MTPLEIKLSQAISDEIQRQVRVANDAGIVDEPVINTDQVAQVVTRTIKSEMAAALRASAAKREEREREVNAAIDEMTR